MKNVKWCLFLVSLVALSITHRASAQSTAPIKGVEPVDTILNANDLYAQRFPNYYDPQHPKLLSFEGKATNDNDTPILIGLKFDWVTPEGTTALSNFNVYEVPVGGGPINANFTIPYCPELVSLHIEVDNSPTTNYVSHVTGTFIHECLVPEPTTIGLTALGLGTLLAFRRRS